MGNWYQPSVAYYGGSAGNWSVSTWNNSNTVTLTPTPAPVPPAPKTALDRLDERIDRVRERVAA